MAVLDREAKVRRRRDVFRGIVAWGWALLWGAGFVSLGWQLGVPRLEGWARYVAGWIVGVVGGGGLIVTVALVSESPGFGLFLSALLGDPDRLSDEAQELAEEQAALAEAIARARSELGESFPSELRSLTTPQRSER